MKVAGGCYCGEIRFEAEGALEAAFQCHCRECQYITGGNELCPKVGDGLIRRRFEVA